MRCARAALLWIVIETVGAARTKQFHSTSKPKNSSTGWLESLRRELMHENYDYLASSGDTTEAATESQAPVEEFVMRAHEDPDPQSSPAYSPQSSPAYSPQSSPAYFPPQYAPVEEEKVEEKGEDKRGDNGISRKDLLYYVDDARLAAPAPEFAPESAPAPARFRLVGGRRNFDEGYDAMEDQEVNNITGAKIVDPLPQNVTLQQPAHNVTIEDAEQQQNVTYEVFQLAGGGRRGGAGPRFVEERGARGVALVSLDGAPFPAFRLPAPRRQYAPVDDDSYEFDR